VRLSVEYGVMNDTTSFVVVDEETEVDKSSSEPLPVNVPQFSEQPVFVPPPILDGTAPPPLPVAPGAALSRSAQSQLPPRPMPSHAGIADMKTTVIQDAPKMKKKAPEPEPTNVMKPMSFAAAAAAAPFKNVTARDTDKGDSENRPANIPFSSLGMEKRVISSPIFREGEIAASLDEFDASREEIESDQELPMSLRLPGPPKDVIGDGFEGGVIKEKKDKNFGRRQRIEKSDSEKMEELLKFQRVDGSFTFSPAAMNAVGWHASDISSFAKSNGMSEELAFNLWILKWLKSDSLKANKKYMIITRNLENWLRGQRMSNPVDKLLDSISSSMVLV